MAENWQHQITFKSVSLVVVGMAVIISMLGSVIRGDDKAIDTKQTVDIEAQEKRIDRLEYSIGKNDAYMEAVQASLARIEADTKESLKRIESDIREIKDKR